MSQFNRQYKIVSNKQVIVDGTVDDAPQVTFTVENIFGGGVSYAEINIYNLSPKNRDLLTDRTSREKAGYRDVELWAGYEGSTSIIFTGVIRNAFRNTPDGVNQVVTMYCRSSAYEYEDREIEQTFGNETPAIDVIKGVASAFGLPVSIYGDFSVDLPYMMGYSASGDIKTELNDLSVTHDFVWQIENKKTVIIKSDSVRSESVKTYDPSNLIIGGTEVTEVGANIVVKLDPSLITYTNVDIKSLAPRANYSGVYDREINISQGRYRVFQVTHTGDFEGDTWETRAQCMR